jgi:hypothetical protein
MPPPHKDKAKRIPGTVYAMRLLDRKAGPNGVYVTVELAAPEKGGVLLIKHGHSSVVHRARVRVRRTKAKIIRFFVRATPGVKHPTSLKVNVTYPDGVSKLVNLNVSPN